MIAMDRYRKLGALRQVWEHPETFRPSKSEDELLRKLESFAGRAQAYNGLIICGDHGVGKTFTVRYFLSMRGLLDDKHYVDMNQRVLDELARLHLGIGQRNKIYVIVQDILKSEDAFQIFDACEILGLLSEPDFQTIIAQIHWCRTKKVIVLPSELGKRLKSGEHRITISFPKPSEADYRVLLENLETVDKAPSRPTSFSEMIRRVVG